MRAVVRVLGLTMAIGGLSNWLVYGQTNIDEITGEWVVTSHIHAAKAVENDLFDTVVFGDGRVMYYGRRTVDEARYRINSNGQPKQLDLIVNQHGRSRVIRGIYRFDGTALVICQAAMGQVRPTVFESTEDDQTTIVVLERKPREGDSNHRKVSVGTHP